MFPVSLIKPNKPADEELFTLKNPTTLTLPQVEQNEDKRIWKVTKERKEIRENIFSDIETQYMKMNGWKDKTYLTQINVCGDLGIKERKRPEYYHKWYLTT
ncbi:hypothetical protein O181_036544 [Austropuccinia psidii MF-1]|uniref:Uncharacterized protein n=1 Tax=Austropuccinia psidii MF-1 TaxID=1389203 RepID=A0A9Q3D4V6_9BASI|nr:hypothetical protein [Austropuccinia psidii MF-1]